MSHPLLDHKAYQYGVLDTQCKITIEQLEEVLEERIGGERRRASVAVAKDRRSRMARRSCDRLKLTYP